MVDQPRSPPKPVRRNGTLSLPETAPGMNRKGPMDKPPDAKGSTKPAVESGKRSADETAKILERWRKRIDRAIAAESEGRKEMVEDKKFRKGIQWPADVAAQRNADKRPCLTINMTDTFVHQITNAQRENRPTINVSPVGDKGDKEAAQMYRGLIRYIERESGAEIAYDTGFDDAVTCGIGYVRLLTEYANEKTFDQLPRIKRVRNLFTVYLDPDRQCPVGSDSKWGVVTEIIPEADFEREYPKAQKMPFDLGGQGEKFKNWSTKDGIRVAEGYEVEYEDAKLVSLSTGYVGFEDDLDDLTKQRIKNGSVEVREERDSYRRSIKYFKFTAVEILEETDWLGKWIPIVPIVGNEIDVEGRVSYSGVIRNAKDSQRMYNYWKTMETELIALAPKAPYIGEEGQFEGHEREWKNANVRSSPYLTYKGTSVSGKPIPPPQRAQPVQIPAGVVNAAQGAMKDMMATTGIRFDPSVMPADLRESGRLVQEQRRNSDIGSFHYIDNFGRSLKFVGEQLVDIIPKLFDRKQVMTILREDDTEEQITLDPLAGKASGETKTADGKSMKVFNPKIGEFGVVVDIGPSYATKRIESAQSMMEFAKALPNTAAMIADLIAKYQDWPGAEEMATRLAKAVPPQLLTPDQKDMSPQTQAVIQHMKQQVEQLSGQLSAAMKALEEKDSDRHVAMDKIGKDYDAKLLKIMADAEKNSKQIALEAARLALDEGHKAKADDRAEHGEHRADYVATKPKEPKGDG